MDIQRGIETMLRSPLIEQHELLQQYLSSPSSTWQHSDDTMCETTTSSSSSAAAASSSSSSFASDFGTTVLATSAHTLPARVLVWAMQSLPVCLAHARYHGAMLRALTAVAVVSPESLEQLMVTHLSSPPLPDPGL